MLPEIKYYSFEKIPDNKINCDKKLLITATCISLSCIIAYFIYLATK